MLKLTKTEVTICKMIYFGYSNKEISDKVHRSIHTINAHVRNIYRKNNLKGRIDLCKSIFAERKNDEK
ncbi:helix-turn-helix transcriptional regulator [Salmonella enterica subsp. salamae]|nr:helix-turn-helix transcriptional regulator [Salmonella enterica subsp. salamae]